MKIIILAIAISIFSVNGYANNNCSDYFIDSPAVAKTSSQTLFDIKLLPELMTDKLLTSAAIKEALDSSDKLADLLLEKGVIDKDKAEQIKRRDFFDAVASEKIFSSFFIMEMISRGHSFETALQVVENFIYFQHEEQLSIALSVVQRMYFYLDDKPKPSSLDKYLNTAKLFELDASSLSRFFQMWSAIKEFAPDHLVIFTLDEISKLRDSVVVDTQSMSRKRKRQLNKRIIGLVNHFPNIMFKPLKQKPIVEELLLDNYKYYIRYVSLRPFDDKPLLPRFWLFKTEYKDFKTVDTSILKSLSDVGYSMFLRTNVEYLSLMQLRQIISSIDQHYLDRPFIEYLIQREKVLLQIRKKLFELESLTSRGSKYAESQKDEGSVDKVYSDELKILNNLDHDSSKREYAIKILKAKKGIGNNLSFYELAGDLITESRRFSRDSDKLSLIKDILKQLQEIDLTELERDSIFEKARNVSKDFYYDSDKLQMLKYLNPNKFKTTFIDTRAPVYPKDMKKKKETLLAEIEELKTLLRSPAPSVAFPSIDKTKDP